MLLISAAQETNIARYETNSKMARGGFVTHCPEGLLMTRGFGGKVANLVGNMGHVSPM